MTRKFKQTEIGKIPEDWEVKELGDICELRAGSVFKRMYQGETKGDYPFIKVSDLEMPENHFCIHSSNNWVSKQNALAMRSNIHPAGATVFAKIGIALTFNRRRLLVKDTIIDNNLMSAIPNTAHVYPYFLYYLLNVQDFNLISEGSALPFLSTRSLSTIKVAIPPFFTQRAIAKILSDLDEKIELNRQMNKTFESIAQAIFKHWFVDFEFPDKNGHPYKSSGGKMVESELGEIPEGWRVSKLGEIIEITSGKRPGERIGNKSIEFNVPLYGASSTMGYVKEALYNQPILIMGRVGTHGVIQRIRPLSFPSDNTLVILPKYYEYTYQVLRNIDYSAYNVGTTQPLITQRSIKNYEVIISDMTTLVRFEDIADSLFSHINDNNDEIELLAQIRDSLLPKLISGKIRVNGE